MASADGIGRARWVVVDVETSGTDPRTCRVISVAALAVTDSGEVTDSVVSLLDAGVDPGPTHIHGLTAEMLSGKPCFSDIADDLARLLRGRTLVAHNAGFDYWFLVAESRRVGIDLPVEQAVCTLDLAGRLELGTASLKLGELARHCGVTQARPHDALDDAQVLSQVFTQLLVIAAEHGVDLPVRDPRAFRVPVFAAPQAA